MRDAARQGLAVGFFDGVHLGHREILRGAAAALTFRNHPLTVLSPERAPRLIMTPQERVEAIRACGVGEVTVLDFTRELAARTAADFLGFLAARGGSVRCGPNWRFGKGGEGDVAYLRKAGFPVEVAPYALYRGEKISSSRIRAALERGEIADANAMLGRRFRVSGQRSGGKGLGAKLGYPTINLSLPDVGIRLPLGVYEVAMAGGRGLANYGLAPTLGDRAWRVPVLEVHLLDSDSAALDPPPTVPVEFLRFLRPERRFDSLEALARQIAADCAAVRSVV